MNVERNYRRILAGASVAAAALLSVPLAGAHDVVIGGSPANGDVVDAFPSTITLEFSGHPREGFNTFAVTDKGSGDVLFSAEPVIQDRNLTIDVPADVEAGPGQYRVGFQITSSDGHSTRGWSDFAVAAADGSVPDVTDGQESEEGPRDTESSSASSPAFVVVGAIAGVLALAGVVVMVLRKGKTQSDLHQRSTDDDHPENS